MATDSLPRSTSCPLMWPTMRPGDTFLWSSKRIVLMLTLSLNSEETRQQLAFKPPLDLTKWKSSILEVSRALSTLKSFKSYFQNIPFVNTEEITTTAPPVKTTTTTRSPEQTKIVYKCDFDKDDCDITIPEESKEYLKVKSTSVIAGYTFTDFLSISTNKRFDTDTMVTLFSCPSLEILYVAGLAGNGLACQIPFTLGENEYYHCTNDNNCLTAGGLAQCQSGEKIASDQMINLTGLF